MCLDQLFEEVLRQGFVDTEYGRCAAGVMRGGSLQASAYRSCRTWGAYRPQGSVETGLQSEPALRVWPRGGSSGDRLARLGQAELVGLGPALQELLLPVLRADLTICETYGDLREEPLPCPFTVLGGAEDGTVTKAELSAWREHKAAEFELRMFPGEHLYLRDVEQQIAEAVTRTLAGRC